MDKDIASALDAIDKVNPFATYLDNNTLSHVGEWIDTGSYVLNAIISGSINGGIPKGRVTMLAGESMTGKSLFVQKILAKAQQEGLTPVIFDTEKVVDKATFEEPLQYAVGVNHVLVNGVPVLIDGEATPRTLDEYDVDYLHNILEQYPKLERVISSVVEELYLSIDSEIENLMKEEDGETN